MKDKRVVIAITGGIGSGKSTAVNILKKAGYPVFSSDQIVAKLYQKRWVLKKIKRLFPSAVSGGFCLKLDRKKLSQIVFSSPADHKALTDLITPMVIERIVKEANKFSGLVFAEVPILFERGYESRFDKVLVIKRDINARIESVIRRSNLNKDEVVARINSQIDYDKINLSAYSVLQNDGDEKALETKLFEFIDSL